MKNILLILSLLFLTLLNAQVLISPQDAMKESYPQSSDIIKKNITLTTEQLKKIQKASHVKLRKKSYTIFVAKKADVVLGYGVLINKKVRSKNGVVLYLIADDKLKSIEIIAFNEPREYLPNKEWQAHFSNKKTDTMLQLSKEIPTITGATLSAKSVVEGSRIAFGIYNELLKGK
jgi:Na+-translocating ferredoxin:NAD+ oxidoreductase RnfG subunit